MLLTIGLIIADNGASIVILSSIQSGYGPSEGKICNKAEGYYTDEETSITAPGKSTQV